mgnify:CR=1 FL=1
MLQASDIPLIFPQAANTKVVTPLEKYVFPMMAEGTTPGTISGRYIFPDPYAPPIGTTEGGRSIGVRDDGPTPFIPGWRPIVEVALVAGAALILLLIFLRK